MQHLKNGSSLQGGKYKIEKVLGQGGFGITYLATQELLDRKVCIKEFFFKEYCERDEATSHVTLGTQSSREMVERFMAKFLKEARTISKLEHPNIIRIHDIFMENNTAYYVMDYIDGESLSEMVKRRGALPESEAVEYIKQVASALDFIHQHSINHLDVKPANIMVSNSDGKAILIDFGLSKQYDAQGGQTSTTPVGISHGYAPMEQYKQGGVNSFSPQTDIYSLGATLYKLVTGNTPPQAMDLIDEGLPSLPSSLSASVVEAIKKAMQFRKVDRPENITEFLNFLRITVDKSPLVQQSTNTQEPKAQSALEETKILDAKQSSSFSTNEAIQPPPQQTDTYKTATAEPSLSSKNLGKDVKNENGNIAYGCIRGVGWIITILVGLGILASIIAECGGGINNNYPVETYTYNEWDTTAIDTIVCDSAVCDTSVTQYTNSPTNEELDSEAYTCYQRKDYTRAVSLWERASIDGHVNSQYNLAYCYSNGLGVKKNIETAKYWWGKAAAQGHKEAKEALAYLNQEREKIQGKLKDTDFVDLGLSVRWASKNYGAKTIEELGRPYTWEDAKKVQTQSYRLPTKNEAQELLDKCVFKWGTEGNQSGYIVTGPSGRKIFLPAADGRWKDNFESGQVGFYWTTTPNENYYNNAWELELTLQQRELSWWYCNVRRSVRMVK